MEVKTNIDGEVLKARIVGDIDHHTAKNIREKIDGVIERCAPKLLVMDFREVSFMDSSGIGLVMGRYKAMDSLGGGLKITNPSPQIRKVMHLAGLDRLAIVENQTGGGAHENSK